MNSFQLAVTFCKKGNKNELIKIIKKEGKKLLQQKEEHTGQTLLHMAAEEGNDDIVQYILSDKYKSTVDINVVDDNGWTPLHAACKGGHINIIETLFKKGAFARALTNEGSSPLHYLVRSEYSEQETLKFHTTISLLIKKGCLIDLQNTHGETPLHQAAIRGRFRTVQYLILLSANVNIPTKHNESILLFAIRGGNEECIKLLLENGANPTIEPKEGVLFDTAKKFQTPNVRNLLRKYFLQNNLSIPAYMGELETEESVVDPPLDQKQQPVEPNINKPISIYQSGKSLSSDSPSRLSSPSATPVFEKKKDKKERRRIVSKSVNLSSLMNFSGSKSESFENSKTQLIHSPPLIVSKKTRLLNEEEELKLGSFEKPQMFQRTQSIVMLGERLEQLKLRANENENNNNNVNNLNEQITSPKKPTQIDKRIELFKKISSNFIDVNSIEEEVNRKKSEKVEENERPKNAIPNIYSDNNRVKNYHQERMKFKTEEERLRSISGASEPTSNISFAQRNKDDGRGRSQSDKSSFFQAPRYKPPSFIPNLDRRRTNNSPFNSNSSNIHIGSKKSSFAQNSVENMSENYNNNHITHNIVNVFEETKRIVEERNIIGKHLVPEETPQDLFKDGWKCQKCSKRSNKQMMSNLPMIFCESPQAFEDLSEDSRDTRTRISSDLCAIDNTKFYIRALIELPILCPSPYQNDDLLPYQEKNEPQQTNDNSVSKEEKNMEPNNSEKINIIEKESLNIIESKPVDNLVHISDKITNNNEDEENNNNNNIDKSAPEELLCGYITIGVWVQMKQLDFFQIIEKWTSDESATYQGLIANNLPFYAISTLGLSVNVSTRSQKRPIISFEAIDHPLALEYKEGIRYSHLEQFISLM